MALFVRTAGTSRPSGYARSQWDPEAVNGTAVAALAGQELGDHASGTGLVPARFSLELLRRVRFAGLETTVVTTRKGANIEVLDWSSHQEGQLVARATLTLLRKSRQPPGEFWTAEHGARPPCPPGPPTRPGLWWNHDGAGPDLWTEQPRDVQNAQRKRIWINHVEAIEGVPMSSVARLAATAELTNTITALGSTGIGYINHDTTAAFTRAPAEGGLGLEAHQHLAAAGLAVNVAQLYDAEGVLGVAVVSSLSVAERRLDLSETEPEWADSGNLSRAHRAS
ncbi:acyl-CoA thioesterase domain-containing protein [Nocardia sp. NPDC023988]|uniref:acyl-CoA thioesterase domain-containing protein n=1 Tax=unclassified Nocardia TaxID=2637762 RepID=UPI003406E781